MDMMNFMNIVDNQHDFPVISDFSFKRKRLLFFKIPGVSQQYRIILKRIHYHIDVGSRTEIAILTFQNSPHNFSGLAFF